MDKHKAYFELSVVPSQIRTDAPLTKPKGYTLMISPGEALAEINNDASHLFLEALKELVNSVSLSMTEANGEIKIVVSRNSNEPMSDLLNALRNFDCDVFCAEKKAFLKPSDFLYQNNALPYTDLLTLTNALLEEIHASFSEKKKIETQPSFTPKRA